MPLRYLSLITLFCLPLYAQVAVPAPRVVASISPIHSLAAFLMQGVAEPELLIQGGQSPHNFTLRPSDMRRLHQADLLVWVGPEVESALLTLFRDDQLKARVVTLTELPDMPWLAPRQHAEWERGHAHRHQTEHAHHQEHDAGIDSHIWLSPQIAGRIGQQLTAVLTEADPAHADQYRHNNQQLQDRLTALDLSLRSRLSPVKEVPYIVFHDAYHYFEHHYGLNAVGSVSLGPDRQPGAQHIHALRSKINRLQARCVFSEPQFRPKLVQTLLEDTQAKSGQLDPLGSRFEPGPEAYFQLMQQLADNLLQCLQ